MSTTKRLVSGTTASWARIVATMLTQILLVPIFLNHWSVKTYGIWIAIQALVNVLGTLDRGYVDYLGYEFLKFGIVNKKKISSFLWSGIIVTLAVASIETVLISILAFSKYLPWMLGENMSVQTNLMWQSGWVLILQWVGWGFCANTTGLFFRALSPFGYYPRMAWWDFSISIMTSLISVIIVTLDGSLLTTGIGTTIFLFSITLIRFFDIQKLLSKEEILKEPFSIKLGLNSYFHSLVLSIRYFMENFRQQGIRLILAPMLGVAALAKFSTIRTVSNVMQQGLMTVTNPLMPELMRFLQKKDQEKTETAFATVWLILVVLLSPGTVLLQLFSKQIFSAWTHGLIEFDPMLLMILSLSVLIYALAQPAMAVIIGNNLLKIQMTNSIVSSLALIMGLLLIIPSYGVLGAGISLLIAETIAALGFIYSAKRWLGQNGLNWPVRPFMLGALSIALSAISMTYSSISPDKILMNFGLTSIGFMILSYSYWKIIPVIIKNKFFHYLKIATV